ncbi:chondroitin sulfate synthase 1-like [Asterias rubens]|uniref:chondroitin sulfate synthase 1-like n=1 Tax=Asterias rubens TaxID=7604 RepID=UPI0014553CE3|nr:chondroitin sulfate synthase 1-like [Asterias rubens]
MGGPGMIFSRETLRLVVPHISYCLKNMWSIHEDVEVGRCIKKFAEIDCTWAYEMQTLFYNNYSKSDTAYTGSLESSDVHNAITLHPIKRTPYMYRLHNYLQSTAIKDYRMKTMNHYRHILEMKQLLNEDAEDRLVLEEDPHVQRLGLQPGLLKYVPDSHEDVITWNFFGKYWYTTNFNTPKRGMPKYQTAALDRIASEVMAIINSNSMKVGRTIDFKEILYGYTRVVPPYGADYVLDLLLMYQKHLGKSKRLPVRRHAYLQQSFGKLELSVEGAQSPAKDTDPQPNVESGVAKFKNEISKSLFGVQQDQGTSTTNVIAFHESKKLKETINFIMPLAGRLEIFKRFMANMERICFIPGENVRLFIVLFKLPQDDPSVAIAGVVSKYSLKYPRARVSILSASGEFSRGLALDLGASQLPPEALMFFVDVDMHISPGFLTRCRLNTIRGKQVYYPAVFGQYSTEVTYGVDVKPESKLAISKETGFFRSYGFGIACMYNSDLIESGGVDTRIIGWGMEDVDLYQKFAASNVTILRAPDPSLIHVYHPVVCDIDLEPKKYQMCIGSRNNQFGSSLNLAKILQKEETDSSEENSTNESRMR